jgi:hypothetical protein
MLLIGAVLLVAARVLCSDTGVSDKFLPFLETPEWDLVPVWATGLAILAATLILLRIAYTNIDLKIDFTNLDKTAPASVLVKTVRWMAGWDSFPLWAALIVLGECVLLAVIIQRIACEYQKVQKYI